MADIKGPDLTTIKKRRRVSLYRIDTNNPPSAIDDALDELSVDGLVPKYSYWEYFSLRYLSYLLRPAGLASIIVLAVALTSALVNYNQQIERGCVKMRNVYVWEKADVPAGMCRIKNEEGCKNYTNLDEFGEIKSYVRIKTPSKPYNEAFKPTTCIENPREREYYNILYGVLQSTMIFMLVMTLDTGIEKYREEIRLYEVLTGHIKSLTMFITHLTYDAQKYERDEDTIKYKDDVKDHYAKLRCVIAVLAPAARLVLKGKRLAWCSTEATAYAQADKLETRKRYRKRNSRDSYLDDCSFSLRKCECNASSVLCCRPCFNRDYRRVPMPWSKHEQIKKALKEGNWEQFFNYRVPENKRNTYKNLLKAISPSALEFALFNKVTTIQETTDMDLFDTLATVLLDEIMVVSENALGFGNDEGSAVMSAVYAKWDAMYAAWGDMSSIKTYDEPNHVHIYRMLMLVGYAILMPFNYIKYVRDSDEFLLYMLWVVVDMMVFLVMWYIAYAIRNPFADVRCMNGVKATSAKTQEQVLKLLKHQLCFEMKDYKKGRYGYGIGDGRAIGFDKIVNPKARENWNKALLRIDVEKGVKDINKKPPPPPPEEEERKAGQKDENGDRNLRYRGGLNF